MGGLRYPRFDPSQPYDLYGGRTRQQAMEDYDRSLSPQRAAVMNRLKPSSPSVYERYGRPALEAVGGIVSAPFRGLGMGLTAAQEALAGTPDSESRLRLNAPNTSVLDDILGKSVTSAPSPAVLALEGYKGIGEELAKDLFPDVLETPSAGRTPEDARAYAKEFPVISRAQSVLDPVTELAFQFVTDPALAGFGALSKSTEAAKTAQAALESGVLPRGAAAAAEAAVSRGRVANIAERALGASFVPGMAEAAFHGGTDAADSFRREGLSPETLRAGTEATLSAILAGTGGAHALTPGLRPTGVPREALNPVLDDILGRAPEVRAEAPAAAPPPAEGAPLEDAIHGALQGQPAAPRLNDYITPEALGLRPLEDIINENVARRMRQQGAAEQQALATAEADRSRPLDEALQASLAGNIPSEPRLAAPPIGPPKPTPIPGQGEAFTLSPAAEAAARGPEAPVPPPAPDVQLRQAEVLARQAGKATVGDLVNGLGVSPSKARRLLGQLEEQGVLGASDKNGVRALVAEKAAEAPVPTATEPLAAAPVVPAGEPAPPAAPPVDLQPAAEPAPAVAVAAPPAAAPVEEAASQGRSVQAAPGREEPGAVSEAPKPADGNSGVAPGLDASPVTAPAGVPQKKWDRYLKARSAEVNTDPREYDAFRKQLKAKYGDSYSVETITPKERAHLASLKADWRRVPVPPKDSAGNPIIPGQEDWTPQERSAARSHAENVLREIEQKGRSQPVGARGVVDMRGAGSGDMTGQGYSVTSHKTGTAFEGLPYEPAEMRQALKTDKGNPIEQDVLGAAGRDYKAMEEERPGATPAEPSDAQDRRAAERRAEAAPVPEERRAAERRTGDNAGFEPPPEEQPRGQERRQEAAPVDLERRVAERRARILEEDPTISEAHAERIARAEDEARTDPLTGLPNARAFQEALKTHAGPVVSMDLGGLGYVNDHLGGHPAGDAFLKAAADAMLEEPGVRPFRAGEKADEFALLADTPEAGEAAAKSIQERFSNAHFSGLRDGKPVRFTGGRIDYGTGTEGATAAERFRHGDTKLYESRQRAVDEGLRPGTKGSRPPGLREVPGPGDVADSSPAPQGPLEPPPPSAASEPPAAPPQYSVRPAPGQRGIPGLGEDVAPPREKAKKPEQSSMFGGEMLQASEARTTEGREGEGALFTQERDARERGEAGAQAGLFATEERAAEAPTPAPEGIADFGEKIGGARKDTARPLGPRRAEGTPADDRPAWQRPYRVFQDAGELTRQGEAAPWRIARGDKLVYRSGRESTFKTRAEAEQALPLMEVSRNHRVGGARDGSFGIYRQITARKNVLVRGGFESTEAARKYMAANPEEIIGHKFPFPEKPWLDHIDRTGPEYRQGDVRPVQFQEAFGFRGGEFGNWNMGSDGQAALNHAYDGLMDLSRTLGVPPKALSLDGKLAIAFGARGHGGKDSARAHYEPDRAVINLTKIKGAGSLAHEWFHALDHYLSNEAGGTSLEGVSHGFPRGEKARPELKVAFERVMREITASEKTQAVEGDSAAKFSDRMSESVDRVLREIRSSFTYEPYNKRMRKPTPEELARFDDLAERIKGGDVGERKVIEGKGRFNYRRSYEPIEELNALYKSVRGNSFATADEGSRGRQLAASVDSMLVARGRVEAAKAGATETKRGASDFLRNSRDIDQYRASDYWSTPHEMAARAFEAYAYDKLRGATDRSDYLTHSVENKDYAGTGMKPYPEGAERQAINKAFDGLFETIKTKETDKGTALYRATGGAEAGSLTLADVRQHIRAPGITETPEGFQFRVGQTGVRIDRVGDIHLEPKAFESGRPGQSSEGLQAVGSYQRVGDLATIKLLAKEGETPRTLLHEAWHLVKDLGLLREGELKAIEKKYGPNEEAQADAYADWNPVTRPDGLFGKIAGFFRNIYRAFRPSAESAFERVRGGKAFEGAAGAATGGPQYATAPKPTPSQVRPIPPGSVPGQPPLAPAAPGGHATAPAPHLNLPEATLADKVATYFQDRLRRLGVVETAVGAQGGKVGSVGENVKAAADALGAKGAAKLEDIRQRYVDPLVQTIAEAKAPLKDLDDYMAILHAPDRDAVIERRTDGKVKNGSGWTDQERQTRWAELEKKYGSGPGGRITGLEPAAKIVRDMRDEQLRVLEDGGLISKAQAQGWKAEMGDHYVPLRTAEVDAGMGTGQGFDIRGKESKAATGRSTKADSPVTFMLQQLQRAVIRAEKNKVDQKFADFVRDNNLFEMDKDHTRTELGPDGKVRTVGDSLRAQKDFSYKVNGETHRIDIASTDPLLDAAMRNLSANERNIVVDHLGKLSRHFSKAVTSMNPAFMFTNFARDIQEAAANAGVEHGAAVAKNVVQGVPHAMAEMYRLSKDPTKATPMAREFKEDGGAVGWYSVQGIPELEKELTSRINAQGPGFGPGVQRLWQRVGQAVSDANGSVENATRFSVYKALRDSGASREKAAHASRNATIDFTKRGEAGPTINALYTFFNANVQGMKRLKEIAIDTPKGRALAGSIVGAGLALDAYNRAMAGDANDDGTNDYDDIPEYVKRRNLVFMRGEGKKPLMIPLPYGFSVFQTIGRQVMSGMAGATKPGQAALNVLSAANNAFNPLGGESFVQMLSPTFLDPFVQHATNETWAGKPLKPEQFPGSPEKPASEMYFKNAPPLAISVARFLNEKTGGDTHTPGFISVSPEVLSLYADAANNMFGVGGYARTAVQAGETAKALASGETPSVRNIPVANRFVYEESPGLEGQKYRANVDELETLWGRFKSYREEGDTEKAGEIPRALLQAKKSVDAIDNRIRSLRRASKVRPDLQAKIGDLQRQANRIVANAKKQAG